jgi:hypothetical protein
MPNLTNDGLKQLEQPAKLVWPAHPNNRLISANLRVSRMLAVVETMMMECGVDGSEELTSLWRMRF